MPGNLAAAAPSGVLPKALCTAFSESRVFPMLSASYHDPTIERSLIVDGVNQPASIRSWKQTRRLAASLVTALRSFFEGQNAGLTPFYFYNPLEPAAGHAIGSNWDGTGASTQGRHTVVFRGGWSQTVELARTNVPLELQEIA